jgi:hypothetical protein
MRVQKMAKINTGLLDLRAGISPEHGRDRTTGDATEQGQCSRTKWLLQCRLAWYGLRAMGVGDLRDFGAGTFSVDLVRPDGSFVDRLEVDREFGTVTRSAALALNHHLSFAA